MNLCVHYKLGTCFIKSTEDSNPVHAGEYIFNWVDSYIKKIGEQLVVQVVTDNVAANMSAKAMMKVVRPNLFWSSYTAHIIDPMLEDIEKLSKYKKMIERARSLMIFHYFHHRTLALMHTCIDTQVHPKARSREA